MSAKFDELVALVEGLKEDAAKSAAGNKSANVRVAKAMLEVKTKAAEVRKELIEARG